jgi:hypothetical protein
VVRAPQARIAWKRAAGVYVRTLSEPELFIEGNHRSGALVMSYILAREGYPPFVLTAENAIWWTPKLGQKLGRLKRESRRLSFPGYAARSLLLDAITFLS